MTDSLGEGVLSVVNLFFEERDIFLFKRNYHFNEKVNRIRCPRRFLDWLQPVHLPDLHEKGSS
jgi:hypothetical protein